MQDDILMTEKQIRAAVDHRWRFIDCNECYLPGEADLYAERFEHELRAAQGQLRERMQIMNSILVRRGEHRWQFIIYRATGSSFERICALDASRPDLGCTCFTFAETDDCEHAQAWRQVLLHTQPERTDRIAELMRRLQEILDRRAAAAQELRR